jgi:hypothetical protein
MLNAKVILLQERLRLVVPGSPFKRESCALKKSRSHDRDRRKLFWLTNFSQLKNSFLTLRHSQEQADVDAFGFTIAMIRSTVRTASRRFGALPTQPVRLPLTSRRTIFNSTSPTQRSRSWKSSAARWGAALGFIYWYNTSDYISDLVSCSFCDPHAAASNH